MSHFLDGFFQTKAWYLILAHAIHGNQGGSTGALYRHEKDLNSPYALYRHEAAFSSEVEEDKPNVWWILSLLPDILKYPPKTHNIH